MKLRATPVMARGGNGAVVLRLLLALSCAATVVHGKEWMVGDSKGWNSGVSGWENRKRFQSGDVLVFQYEPRKHNVVQVEQGDYQSCMVSGPAKAYTSGDDHIPLSGGQAFFICSLPGHCERGMKIAVTVE